MHVTIREQGSDGGNNHREDDASEHFEANDVDSLAAIDREDVPEAHRGHDGEAEVKARDIDRVLLATILRVLQGPS